MFLNHWSSDIHKEWIRQDAQYSFFAIIDLKPLKAKIQEVTSKIVAPYLPALPIDEMHLTLMSIAAKQHVTNHIVDTLTREVTTETSSIVPITVTLGEPSVWDEGVVVPIQENTMLQDLRSSLFAISQKVIGPDNLIAGPSFYPHLTLAYANQSGSKNPIEKVLEEYRDKSVGSMTITGVELVKLWRENQRYDYTVVSSIPSVRKQEFSGNRQLKA